MDKKDFVKINIEAVAMRLLEIPIILDLARVSSIKSLLNICEVKTDDGPYEDMLFNSYLIFLSNQNNKNLNNLIETFGRRNFEMLKQVKTIMLEKRVCGSISGIQFEKKGE